MKLWGASALPGIPYAPLKGVTAPADNSGEGSAAAVPRVPPEAAGVEG